MRRKRFKHQAYIICHMFCGWQLYADYEYLAKLAAGELHINILNKKCLHNGKLIEPLKMAEILNIWLFKDLETNRIRPEHVNEAILDVEFAVKKIRFRKIGIFDFKHDFYCKGKIRSDNDIYIVHFKDKGGVHNIIQKTT